MKSRKQNMRKNILRVKDNKFIFCALQEVIKSSIQKAQDKGIRIDHIIHKVFRFLYIIFKLEVLIFVE